MKNKKHTNKAFKRIVTLVLALMLAIPTLAAFSLVGSAETSAPDTVAGATEGGNNASGGNNGYFSWGNDGNGNQNGMPTPPHGSNGETPQFPNGNGTFPTTPPDGGNGTAPTLPELPNGNGGSGNNAAPQFPDGSVKSASGFTMDGRGFDYAQACFWMLVGISAAAVIAASAVGVTKLARRSAKKRSAQSAVNSENA